MVELADGNEQWKPMTCALHLYVPDTDATFRRALEAGATSLFEPADIFYGDRSGGVLDPPATTGTSPPAGGALRRGDRTAGGGGEGGLSDLAGQRPA